MAVVISTWIGGVPHHLLRLCDSISHHPAGFEYDLVLCANGLDYVLPSPLTKQFGKVFVRENTDYNLGAWDYAWRHLPNHDHFLFVQDECVALRSGWLRDFVDCFVSKPHSGLVGENIDRFWDKPWSELCVPRDQPEREKNRETRQCAQWARFFREKLRVWKIPEGQTARHVTTVVHFTSRAILEEVSGYNFGSTKLEATAAEIGFSRKIAARGYTLAQIGHWRHSRIAHPQWPSNAPHARLWRSIKKRLCRSH